MWLQPFHDGSQLQITRFSRPRWTRWRSGGSTWVPSCVFSRSKKIQVYAVWHVTMLAEKCMVPIFLVNIPVYTTIQNAPCLVTRQIRFPHVSISGFETSKKMEGSYLVPGAVAPGILNSAGFGGFVPSWDHWDFGGWKLPWKKPQGESAPTPRNRTNWYQQMTIF